MPKILEIFKKQSTRDQKVEYSRLSQKAAKAFDSMSKTFSKYFYIPPENANCSNVLMVEDINGAENDIKKEFFLDPISVVSKLSDSVTALQGMLLEEHNKQLEALLKNAQKKESNITVVSETRETIPSEAISCSQSKKEKQEARNREKAIESLDKIICDKIITIAIIDTNPLLIELIKNNSKSIGRYKRTLQGMIRDGSLYKTDYDTLAYPDKWKR